MCKGTLPDIQLSNVMCTFRPKTSFAPTPPTQQPFQQDLQSNHFTRMNRQGSKNDGRLTQEITKANTRTNCLVEDDLYMSTLDCATQIRPKTVRVTSKERTLCNSGGLLTLSAFPNDPIQNNMEHKKREIVVFLPSGNQQNHAEIHMPMPSHLPEIRPRSSSQSHSSEESLSRCKTSLQQHELTPLRLCQLPNTRHSALGLPLIGSPRPEKRILRRVKSHDLEGHLKNAEKEYDKYEAKAALVYNWMKTQNDSETLDSC